MKARQVRYSNTPSKILEYLESDSDDEDETPLELGQDTDHEESISNINQDVLEYQESTNSEEVLQLESATDEDSDASPTYLMCDYDSSQDSNRNSTTTETPVSNDPEDNCYMIVVSNKDPKTNAKIKCEICKLTFSDRQESKQHVLTHKSCKECEICNNIMGINAYDIHMKLHKEEFRQRTEKNKVKCKICGVTVGKNYLKFHVLKHGSTKDKMSTMKQCPLCDKYVNYHYFSDHIKRKHSDFQKNKIEENSEKCPICDHSVKESKLKEHIANHGKQKNKQYVCDQCGKVLKNYSGFYTHILTHTGNLKYKCQYCPYKGLHLGLLKVHLRTHTKDYPYVCTICGKKFITKSNLSQHERSHKPPEFSCSMCSKKFCLKHSLEVHVNAIHLNIKKAKCALCGKMFATKNSLRVHERTKHKMPTQHSFRTNSANYLKAKFNGQNIKSEH